MVRAQEQTRSFLEFSGLPSAQLGFYRVELKGEDLVVSVLPAEGWEPFEL